MDLSFLSPGAGAVAAAVVVIVAVAWTGFRRLIALSRLLGLRPPPASADLGSVVAAVVLAALVGVAAAQPVVSHRGAIHGRTDAEVFTVFDITRSMGARVAPSAPSRLDRARAAALTLRSSVPHIPFGVASLTDRLLPHLMPTLRTNSFVSVVNRSLGINQPAGQIVWGDSNGTLLSTLGDLGTQGYFDPQARHRVAVVFTDGESQPFDTARLKKHLERGHVDIVFVRIWGANERVFDLPGHAANPYYLPAPGSGAALSALAKAIDASVFDVTQPVALAARVTQLLGHGKTGVHGEELQTRTLAPFVMLLALLPLAYILWRRNAVGAAQTTVRANATA